MSFMRRNLAKNAAFVMAASSASFGIAMYVDYKNRSSLLSLKDLRRKITDSFSSSSSSTSMVEKAKTFWSNQRASQKTIIFLIAANYAVFFLWRVPALHSFMYRNFMHSISTRPINHITSSFSHISFLHISLNMFGLWSFGSTLHDLMGREQFLAFYFSAALFSSFASHLWKMRQGNLTRSLGASGAVLGSIGALSNTPGLSVSTIFLPFISVPMSTAVPLMMAFDVIGLMKNWQTVDHAAHLGGALFGLFYCNYGYKIWQNRHEIVDFFRIKR